MEECPEKKNKGSQRDIQILINEKTSIINSVLIEKLKVKKPIEWVSPLKHDQYREFRDEEFLKKLKLENKVISSLNKFWPKNGPCWDALGKSGNLVFLVEAKANIAEIVTNPSCAGLKSLGKIKTAFCEVKKYLKIIDPTDWSEKFYQYANRLAHLYYLRVLKGLDAYLIFIYFINDETVETVRTIEKWQGAIETMKYYLGIPKRHKLNKYIIDVFIDVNLLK